MFGRETFIVRIAEDAMAPRVREGPGPLRTTRLPLAAARRFDGRPGPGREAAPHRARGWCDAARARGSVGEGSGAA